MGLKAGSIGNLQNSMALAMEKAFKDEWKKVYPGQDVPVIKKDMQLIFVAVAQGVVNHLTANENAFEISVKNGAHSHPSGGNGSHIHTTTLNINDTNAPNNPS